jgi:hypothetical protein
VRTSRGFVLAAWGVRWQGNGADSEPGGWLRVRWGRSKRPGIWASPKGSSPAPRSADRSPPPGSVVARRTAPLLSRSRTNCLVPRWMAGALPTEGADGEQPGVNYWSLCGGARSLGRVAGARPASRLIRHMEGLLALRTNGLAPIPLPNHGNRPRRKRAASARWGQPHGCLRLGPAKALGQDPAESRGFLRLCPSARGKSLQQQTGWRWGQSLANPSPEATMNCVITLERCSELCEDLASGMGGTRAVG